ncbi:MAG: family 43 glycosylhydrolase [Anaerolineaceae bacterium]|nr:family 43 glycosylhydrolase [Anaerolineaceae bacterium]
MRGWIGLTGLLLTFMLAACAVPTEAAPTVTTAVAAEETEILLEEENEMEETTFTNPVLDQDFPDPDVLRVGDIYYAYATNTNGINIQAAKSTDLVHWDVLGDMLPKLPDWAVQDFGWAWAPEVYKPVEGDDYLMYFVARYAIGSGGTQCIGVARSASPEGPFEPIGDAPFICQVDEGGSIDAASFIDDDGQQYVLWKNDGNSMGVQTWLYLQAVSPDGLTLQGDPVRLLTVDQHWEGVLVEAPTLWKQDGRYYLFYSANAYNDQRYAVGCAVADSVSGPYQKVSDEPILKTTINAGIVGPGGQDVVIGPRGDTWLLFHGWAPEAFRHLRLLPLVWEEGIPRVVVSGRDPIPLP